MQRVLAAVLVLAAIVTCGACSDSKPEITSTAPLTAFSATWEGTVRDSSGTTAMLAFSIEPGGFVAEVTIDGVVQPGTGFLSRVNDQVFQGTFGATSFFLMMDRTAEYAILFTDDFDFGVMQRVSSPFPSQFSTNVVEEEWSGQGFTITNAWSFGQVFDSSVRVRIASREFEGGDSDGYTYLGTSPLDVIDPGIGLFGATFETAPAGNTGDLIALVSADGDFTGVMSCETMFVNPPMMPAAYSLCRFRGLTRQDGP